MAPATRSQPDAELLGTLSKTAAEDEGGIAGRTRGRKNKSKIHDDRKVQKAAARTRGTHKVEDEEVDELDPSEEEEVVGKNGATKRKKAQKRPGKKSKARKVFFNSILCTITCY